uniref:Uncharacterized protein n=1 Tax=Rhizophora mucronata TaxID=61149 RepID=A0A2P2IR56_RHIMU
MTGIAIKLNSRKGDNSNLIFGSDTKAHVTAPTHGSVGINRNLTQISPSMSKFRSPTGTMMGITLNFNESIRSMRAPPVYRRPIWYCKSLARRDVLRSTFLTDSGSSPKENCLISTLST